MIVDPGLVGTQSEIKEFEVEKGAIRAFASAIGADHNQLYMDEAFARQHGFASIVAPPTFPTTFRIAMPGLPADLSRRIHGEQAYQYERPIVAGDVLRCQNTITDIKVRTGKLGQMTIVKTQTRGEDLSGNLVFTAEMSVIYR